MRPASNQPKQTAQLPLSRQSNRQQLRAQLEPLEPRLLLCADDLYHESLAYHVGTFAAVDLAAAKRPTAPSRKLARPASSSLAVPVLHSHPSATAKLFLDFDGDISESWAGFTPDATPAFDRDGNPNSFSKSELATIREIWDRVAEKFSPFNLDVTTEDPGNLDDGRTLRVVLGGNGAWFSPMVGGVAFIGGFANSLPNTVWTFTDNLANGDPKLSAEAAAHEAGHGFGLLHQSVWAGGSLASEYNYGTNDAAPIMGGSFYASRGLWWHGTPSDSPDYLQDDMAIIARVENGFGYRADDHSNVLGQATWLHRSGNALSGQGIIEKRDDQDLFAFQSGAGPIMLQANLAEHGPMLKLQLELRDASGQLIQTEDAKGLDRSITATVQSGTYYLRVASQGGYGDVGQYTITGQVMEPASDSNDSNDSPATQARKRKRERRPQRSRWWFLRERRYKRYPISPRDSWRRLDGWLEQKAERTGFLQIGHFHRSWLV